MIERVLRNTQATASFTFPTAPDATPAPTVDLTREDGTVVEAGRAVTLAGADATVALTPADTAALDLLRLTWRATIGGAAQTFESFVEVVGGFLFEVADLRRLAPFRPEDGEAYSDEDIARARTVAEVALEDACGVAFVPRYARERVRGTRATDLLVSRPRPLTVRAVTLNGLVLDATALAGIEVEREGVLYRDSGWGANDASLGYSCDPCGSSGRTGTRRNVEVVYEHGHPFPPARVHEAAMKLARLYLVESPVDDRAVSVTSGDGTYQVFVTAGVRGAVFSIPEANAVVTAYGFVRGIA